MASDTAILTLYWYNASLISSKVHGFLTYKCEVTWDTLGILSYGLRKSVMVDF